MSSNAIHRPATDGAPFRAAAPLAPRLACVLALLLSVAFASLALADDIETLQIIDGVFGGLLLAVYWAAAGGACFGFAVYIWRRRHLRAFPIVSGFVAAMLGAALALWGANATFSTEQSQRCSSEVLRGGEDASDYDKLCREYRELPANAIGLVAPIRALARLDSAATLTPFMVRFSGYLSVAVLAALGFALLYLLHLLIGRPLAR